MSSIRAAMTDKVVYQSLMHFEHAAPSLWTYRQGISKGNSIVTGQESKSLAGQLPPNIAVVLAGKLEDFGLLCFAL